MTEESKSGDGRVRVIEIVDEREPTATAALNLIAESFPPYERHPLSELRSELEEKRRGLLQPFDFHLFAAVDGAGRVLASTSGVYLAGVNAGFVAYLAARQASRGRGVGARVRRAMIQAFREDARRAGREDLAWVIGEVREDSKWLKTLVRRQGVIPFDLNYYHPGMRIGDSEPYVLYREPVGDSREELTAAEVRQVVYAVWRRAYRVRYPLERDTFRAMIEELDGREIVGIPTAAVE